MPSQAIQKTAQKTPASARTLAPQASLRLWAAHRERDRLDRLEAWIAELSERDLPDPTPNLDRLVAPVIRGFGEALQADRVTFFAPSAETAALRSAAFDSVAEWSTDAPQDSARTKTPPLIVDPKEPRGCALRAGRAARSVDLTGSADSGAGSSPAWSPVKTTIFLPCLAGARLLGVFALEGTLGASRWTPAILKRMEFAGRIWANVLDRRRLTLALERQRAQGEHQDRLSTLGHIANSVAHDFNNVLTAILGYADLLDLELGDRYGRSTGQAGEIEAEADAVPGRVELDEIRCAATRAAGLVEDVLAFGRTRKNSVERLPLAQTIGRFEGMIRRVLGKEIALEIEPGLGVPSAEAPSAGDGRLSDEDWVAVDPRQLERVLLNLAANARDALAGRTSGSRLALSTRRVEIDAAGREHADAASATKCIPDLKEGTYVRLTARDNGCGIEPDRLEAILEPYFTTKVGTGSGLGLAMSAEFVRDAGGGIRVESQVGTGSAFHLYLPLVDSAEGQRTRDARP